MKNFNYKGGFWTALTLAVVMLVLIIGFVIDWLNADAELWELKELYGEWVPDLDGQVVRQPGL